MAKKYVFRTDLKWSGAKKGSLSSAGKLSIGVGTPPEFNGEEGYWSPEELLLSAVESCIMTTFLAYCEKKNIDFTSYESNTEGVLEIVDKKFVISEIIVRPRIRAGSLEGIGKIKQALILAEKNCFISNSVKSEVEILPEIHL